MFACHRLSRKQNQGNFHASAMSHLQGHRRRDGLEIVLYTRNLRDARQEDCWPAPRVTDIAQTRSKHRPRCASTDKCDDAWADSLSTHESGSARARAHSTMMRCISEVISAFMRAPSRGSPDACAAPSLLAVSNSCAHVYTTIKRLSIPCKTSCSQTGLFAATSPASVLRFCIYVQKHRQTKPILRCATHL